VSADETATDWRERLTAYLRENARPAYKYGHQPRLYALATSIATQAEPPITFDDDIVFAAAFLHDLGVFIGHRPENAEALRRWDHVAYTCDATPGLLAGFGFPVHKIPAVLSAICEHQPGDTPRTVEAELLRDADILEQLGAVGILRTAAKLDSDTRFHLFADVERTLAYHVESLPGKLRLSSARRLAAPRIAVLAAFLESLRAETGPNLG
jgi:uncharacterized protein